MFHCCELFIYVLHCCVSGPHTAIQRNLKHTNREIQMDLRSPSNNSWCNHCKCTVDQFVIQMSISGTNVCFASRCFANVQNVVLLVRSQASAGAGRMVERYAHPPLTCRTWDGISNHPQNCHHCVSQPGWFINVCEVNLGIRSAGMRWWKLKIPRCPSRRAGKLSPVPWTNYKFVPEPARGTATTAQALRLSWWCNLQMCVVFERIKGIFFFFFFLFFFFFFFYLWHCKSSHTVPNPLLGYMCTHETDYF